MKTKIVLLASLLTTFIGFSQKKWTLKECVDHALKNNITIQQNKLNISAAEKDVKTAKGNFLPTFSAYKNGGVNFGSSFDFVTNNRVSTSTFGSSLGINGGINIFNGFSNLNSKKQALLQVEGSKLDLAQIENNVALNVVNTYLNVLFAKENLSVAVSQAEISKKQIERAKAQFEAGAVPKGDLLNVESTAASDLQNVIIQENTLDFALLQLSQLLQIDVANFDVAAINVGTPSSAMLYSNASQVYTEALKNRPEIKRAELNVENSKLSIDIAKSAYLPTLTASAQLNSTYGYNLKSNIHANLLSQLDDNLGYGVGFSLNVPIFNGFRTDANVEKTIINKKQTELTLESEKLQLQQTIEQAFLDAKAAAKTYEVAQISLNAQKEAFKNAQVSYDYGSMTQFDFDQVRTRYVDAEATLIRAKYDYFFKTKVLKFYFGENIAE